MIPEIKSYTSKELERAVWEEMYKSFDIDENTDFKGFHGPTLFYQGPPRATFWQKNWDVLLLGAAIGAYIFWQVVLRG